MSGFVDAAASLDQLRAQDGAGLSSFTVGFCSGGMLSFLAGATDMELAGVVGFYAALSRSMDGRGTLIERAGDIRVPALGLFGGADQGIPVEQVEALDQALDGAGAEHTIVIYPEAPHSFFDRRATEFGDALADAWTQVLRFIGTQAKITDAAG